MYFIVEEVQNNLLNTQSSDKNNYFKQQASDLFLAKNNEKKVFQLRHDILSKDLKLIIDTKYKIRKIDDKKCGIGQGDMYQMVIYALRRGFENVLLLYPRHLDNIEEKEPDLLTVNSGFKEKIEIKIKASDLNILKKDKENLKNHLLELLTKYKEQSSS